MSDPEFRCIAWKGARSATSDTCSSCGRKAVLTLVGEHRTFPSSRIVSIRNDRVDLLANEAPSYGSLVQIECGDVLALGEIVSVQPQLPAWKIVVRASEILRHAEIGPFFAARPA